MQASNRRVLPLRRRTPSPTWPPGGGRPRETTAQGPTLPAPCHQSSPQASSLCQQDHHTQRSEGTHPGQRGPWQRGWRSSLLPEKGVPAHTHLPSSAGKWPHTRSRHAHSLHSAFSPSSRWTHQPADAAAADPELKATTTKPGSRGDSAGLNKPWSLLSAFFLFIKSLT